MSRRVSRRQSLPPRPSAGTTTVAEQASRASGAAQSCAKYRAGSLERRRSREPTGRRTQAPVRALRLNVAAVAAWSSSSRSHYIRSPSILSTTLSRSGLVRERRISRTPRRAHHGVPSDPAGSPRPTADEGARPWREVTAIQAGLRPHESPSHPLAGQIAGVAPAAASTQEAASDLNATYRHFVHRRARNEQSDRPPTTAIRVAFRRSSSFPHSLNRSIRSWAQPSHGRRRRLKTKLSRHHSGRNRAVLPSWRATTRPIKKQISQPQGFIKTR